MSSKTGAVYWMDLTFFTFICCNNCNFYLKRPKINKKEAGDGPCFLKKLSIWTIVVNSLFCLLISLSCLNTFLSSFLSLSLSLLLHILSSSLNIWITLYFQVMCIRYSILLTHCGLPTLCYILYLSVNPIDVSFFVLHFCLYYLGI